VVTPCGRGSRPGGRHATRGPTQVGPWLLQVGMVSLPGWGGPWERRERLGSDGSDIAKKRYNLPHPRAQQTTCSCDAVKAFRGPLSPAWPPAQAGLVLQL